MHGSVCVGPTVLLCGKTGVAENVRIDFDALRLQRVSGLLPVGQSAFPEGVA